jgi:Cu+-exporting ATPase
MKYKENKDTFKDPVCGMTVNKLTASATCEHGGKIYYFCADVCRDKFEKEPDKFISKWLPPGL